MLNIITIQIYSNIMQFNINVNDLYEFSNDIFDIENITYVKSYLEDQKMDITNILKLLNINNKELDKLTWYKYVKSDFFIDEIRNDKILLILSKLYIYLLINKENINNI